MKMEDIIATVGANQAVSIAMTALLDPGDEVLVPNPSWLHYFYCADLAGAKTVSYPLLEENDFNVQIEDIEKLISPKTKMIIVNSPNNPTGSVLSRESLEKIARIAKDNDLIVLSDEIYEKLLYDDSKHTSIASLPEMAMRTIIINGVSKAYAMTGWRIGFAASKNPDFISAMIRVLQYTVTCATSVSQYAAEAALNGPQECIEEMRVQFDERRKLVYKSINEIEGLSCNCPKGAFYCFMNVKALGITDEEASDYYLNEAGVAMIPGSAFGEYGSGYLRIAFSNSYENIEKAMGKIKRGHRKTAKKNKSGGPMLKILDREINRGDKFITDYQVTDGQGRRNSAAPITSSPESRTAPSSASRPASTARNIRASAPI